MCHVGVLLTQEFLLSRQAVLIIPVSEESNNVCVLPNKFFWVSWTVLQVLPEPCGACSSTCCELCALKCLPEAYGEDKVVCTVACYTCVTPEEFFFKSQ